MEKFIIPGIYATISDYNKMNLATTPKITEKAVVYFCDLPDFVYLPDENSSDVNAIKRVRVVPNKLIPVTNQKEILALLTGTNIIDGILTQAQKDELQCKDVINLMKILGKEIELGEVALVKIVKRDGHRPDMNNIFEVQQALENAYEKLESFKSSQIVITGLPAELDFEKLKPDSSKFQLDYIKDEAVVKQETINNYIYEFSPVGSHKDVKVELDLDQPKETFVHTPSSGEATLEATIIKEYGLDSAEAKHLLTGNIKVNGIIVKDGIQLKYENNNLVTEEEFSVPIINGECSLEIGMGTIFKTVMTETLEEKLVVKCKDDAPCLNAYENKEPRIMKSILSNATPNVGEEVTLTLELSEKVNLEDIEFTSTNLVNNEATLDAEGKKYTSKIKSESEQGEQTFQVGLKGKTPISLTLNIGGRKRMVRSSGTVVEYPAEIIISKANQGVIVNITKENSPWIQSINKITKEETDLITVLEGAIDGVEKYSPKKSGSFEIGFKKSEEKVFAVVKGVQGEVEVEIQTEETGAGIVVKEDTNIQLNDMTVVLKKGLLALNTVRSLARTIFFSKTDIKLNPVYTINYLKANTEPVMESLKFVQKLVQTLSETLIVWGTTPCFSEDPEKIMEHVQKLSNTAKFRNGFKVRLNSGKEVDLGKFLTVVYGTPKLNNVGGINSNLSTKVTEFEKEHGGTGKVKAKTNKIFVSSVENFYIGANVELQTYVDVHELKEKARIIDIKEYPGKYMLVLNHDVETAKFIDGGFDTFISNLDNVDLKGSYAASIFASSSNEEKDRAPVQKDIAGKCDTTLPYNAKEMLIKNGFTVIDNDPTTGLGIIVSSPVMTRTDSDYRDRIDIGSVLFFLNKLRMVSNSKKNKRFPAKEDKVLFEDELKEVFEQEMSKKDAIITGYNFAANFEKLDSHGFVAGQFKIKPSKKLKVVEFTGGIAKIKD